MSTHSFCLQNSPAFSSFQLFRQITKKQVFPKYEEGELKFPPSYKFDINTDVYDTRWAFIPFQSFLPCNLFGQRQPVLLSFRRHNSAVQQLTSYSWRRTRLNWLFTSPRCRWLEQLVLEDSSRRSLSRRYLNVDWNFSGINVKGFDESLQVISMFVLWLLGLLYRRFRSIPSVPSMVSRNQDD